MKALSLRHLLIKNTGVQMIGHLVSLSIGLLTSLVLSRYLGVEGFGKFNYVFAFFYFFLTLNDFGVNTIVIREASKRRESAGDIIGAMLSFKLLLSAVSVLIAWATIGMADFPTDLRNALFIYTFILPIIALQLPAVIFQVALKLEYPALIGICNRLFGFVLLLIIVGLGYGLVALVASLVLAETAAMMMVWRYSRSLTRPDWRFEPKLWQGILRSSLPLGVTGALVAVINRVDIIMLERMRDMYEVGLYSAVYKVTNLLEAFPLMIMATVYPLMARYANEDMDGLRSLYARCVLCLGAVAVPMGIAITLLAPTIIRLLFGAEFAEASPALMVLVWSTVFIYFAISGGNLLISVGMEKTPMYILAIGVFVNVGLNLLWIPTMGFLGAAWSTAVAYFVILVGTMTAVRIYLRENGRALSVAPSRLFLH